jgi:RNA polymerase sigma-70 factor (ECF subfamily)
VAGDPAGQEALYEAFAPGLRLFLAHHLQRAEEVEDRLHDVFVQAVAVIREGQLREPKRLAGFMRTIARRQIAAFIQEVVAQRETGGELAEGLVVPSLAPSPEVLAIRRQGRERALEVLGSFSQVDREILIRFYLRGEEPEDICRELALTANQFRLRKSRAKRRFVRAMGREAKKDHWLSEFPMRKKPASAH